MAGMRCLILFVCATLAAWSASPVRADDAVQTVHYAGYAKGLNAFDLEVAVSLSESAYRMQLSFRMAGVVGVLFHAEGTTTVDGRFNESRIVPRSLVSQGRFRGEPHLTQIDWQGGFPKVKQMIPPADPEREPVPLQDQAQTVDTLSAIAGLLHQVSKTGRCESSARTFDGTRLSEFSARTIGPEVLEPTGRSSFEGRALRCDVTGRMLAGFKTDDDRAEVAKPKHGSVWFAQLQPGKPFIPVRIVFYTIEGSTAATVYVKDPA